MSDVDCGEGLMGRIEAAHSGSAPSHVEFRRLLETLPAGAYTCDRAGHITYYNARAVELWGRAPTLNDPVDRFCGSFKLYSAQGTPIGHDQCWMALALSERQRYNGQEIIVERPDGERRTVLAHANPLYDDFGNVTGAVNVLVDITDRKQVEEQLKTLNETLEQRVQDRTDQLRTLAGELTRAEERERRRLAQVLHDHLQQLLVAAKLRTELLRSQSTDQKTREAAIELHGLLDQTLSCSRSLTFELSPPILYEHGLTAALEWLAQWMEERHGLKVHLHAEPDADPAAQDVRILLFQAARELLFNIVKHAQVTEAWMRLTRDEGQTRLTIEDRGRGFVPIRAMSHEAPKGFGLFSIRERLSLMDGRMSLDSAPGCGVQVALWAPLGRIRVLLADDHAILGDGLALLLNTQPDMELIGQASDGQMAVELSAKLRPDVIIMDVAMPQLDGMQATRRIKAALPDAQVIALSLHVDKAMAAAMHDAGASAYLTKGGPGKELVRTIRRVASHKAAAPKAPPAAATGDAVKV